MPSHTKSCTCHAKSSSQTWRSHAPKCNPSQEISALTYCACHGKCIFAGPLQMSHACHSFWTSYKTLAFCSLLTRCRIPCACHARRHPSIQKCSVPLQFFALLTSTFASRHNGMHFFDIWTSKSAPKPLICQHFWLRNVLRATKAYLTWKCASRHNGVHFCNISTFKSAPNMWCFYHFASICASRHYGVHVFDIWTSKSAPTLRCF